MSDTTSTNQDETTGFVVTSSDLPQVEPTPQEAPQEEAEATAEPVATEGVEGQEVEAKETEAKEQDDSGSDSDAAAQSKADKPNRVQKRIDKVVRQREEERRKNEALQKRIAELEGNTKDKGTEQAASEPVESDYDTYDEYLDALDSFDKAQSTESKPKAKADTEKQSEETQSLTDNQKTAMAVIRESVESAEKPDDFNDVALDPSVPITGDMLEALAECDDPAKVMYHLGQNKDLAAQIADGSAVQQMRAIAKLDITVTSKPPKPIKTTQAPEPITPVAGSDAQQKAPTEMTQAEYEEWANKRERKRQSW